MASQNQITLQHDDIIRMGILKTGKKGKKRFCVLRQDSYNAPARLDCYESEKRFRQCVQPKSSIKLKDVFNINKTVFDGKLKNCIGIYAWGVTLALGCENGQDQEAWLYTLLNVYNSVNSGTPEEDSRCLFDHCWDVVVMEKGLADKKSPQLRGEYRLCLTSCSIFLYQKSSPLEACIEFPLVCISNYGHKTDVFYLRVGRSAITGQGELWMQTEDASVAQNIHENMKRILDENHEYRQRSASLTETKRQNLRGSLSHSRGAYCTSGSSEKLPSNSSSFTGKLSTYSNHRLTNSPVSWFYSGQPRRRSSGDASSVTNTSPTSLPDHEGVKSTQRRQNMSERTASMEYVSSQPTIIEEGGSGGDYLPMQSSSAPAPNINESIGEYTPMAPLSQSTGSNLPYQSRPCLQRKKSWNLEEVRSYISDNDSNASSSVCLSDVNTPVKTTCKSASPPLSAGMPSSLLSRITQGWPGASSGGGCSGSDDRQRAHSFGSWNKHQITRKHSSNLVSQLKEKDDNFRQRSESFGSSPPNNKIISRLFGRFNSKRSNHSEDLVEMDFGPSYSSTGHSLSGSLSSSESLFRSRTNSFNTGAIVAATTGSITGGGRQSWSPKIEQIIETDTPTGRLIHSIEAERLLKERQRGCCDYVPMSCDIDGGSGRSRQSQDSTYDYVVMNSRRRFSDQKEPQQADCSKFVGTFDVHYVDASSGYSSTGDCSEIGQQLQQQQQHMDEFKPHKILTNVQPSCRFSDVQSEIEVTRRLAKVDIGPLPSSSSSSPSFFSHNYENVDYPTIKTSGGRNSNNNNDNNNNNNNNRSPSSVSSVTPTPSPLGSANCVLPAATTNEPSISSSGGLELTFPTSGHHSASCCRRTPSPKQLLAAANLNISNVVAAAVGANLVCGSDESGNKSDVIYTPVDMSKMETLAEVVASN